MSNQRCALWLLHDRCYCDGNCCNGIVRRALASPTPTLMKHQLYMLIRKWSPHERVMMNFKFAKMELLLLRKSSNDSARKRAITFSKELVAYCNLMAAFAAKLD